MKKIIVDAIGDACPIPVVKTTAALKGLTETVTLEVQVDNEIAVQNILRLASGKGFTAAAEKLEEKLFAVRMVAHPASEEAAPTPAAPSCQLSRKRGVVAIGSSTMGSGDDTLGRTLMKAFLYALSQQETLPETILFYNGGAMLTTEGSASIEDLKSMEAQGVEILTCGTCLDFYGRKDKLLVGGVTNMYQIVETLTRAELVIRP